MNLIGRWSNFLGLTRFDHMANHVHIPINFLILLIISEIKQFKY